MKYFFTLSLAYVLYGSSPYPVDSLLKVNGTGLNKKQLSKKKLIKEQK